MAKKEKGFLAGLSDEMVAAAKQYLFDIDGQTSPELQRGMDLKKIADKAHPAIQPTLMAVATEWLDKHMPIGAKSVSRPFDEENKQPWWMYDPPVMAEYGVRANGEIIKTDEEGHNVTVDQSEYTRDISPESRYIAEQAGLGRQDVIDMSRSIKGGYTPPEKRLPMIRYLEPGESVQIPGDRPQRDLLKERLNGPEKEPLETI